MWVLLVSVLGALNAADSAHLSKNPVFQELRETGIRITEKDQIKLPEPAMADGLNAEEQKAIITKLAGRRYRWENLTRPSPVAPQIMEIQKHKSSDPQMAYQELHVYFIAYGDVPAIAQAGGLAEPDQDDDQQWKTLTAEKLAARKIEDVDQEHESYGLITNDLIDRVRVSGVLRTYWSQTEDSLVAAAHLDPRFNEDAEYPNRWQPLLRTRGPKKVGEAKPYHGAGGYTKITRLAEPEGALFVESHVVFAEPHGWFEGANLLGSKLPPVIQAEVRSTRREILDASKRN